MLFSAAALLTESLEDPGAVARVVFAKVDGWVRRDGITAVGAGPSRYILFCYNRHTTGWASSMLLSVVISLDGTWSKTHIYHFLLLYVMTNLH